MEFDRRQLFNFLELSRSFSQKRQPTAPWVEERKAQLTQAKQRLITEKTSRLPLIEDNIIILFYRLVREPATVMSHIF